jgi:hypothetical protein
MSAIMMVVMMTITMCVMMTSSMMCVITMMDHVFAAMLCAALGTTLGCCTKQIIERKSK